MTESNYLDKRAMQALGRLGDIFCPRNGEFPSFTESGCLEHVDKMLACIPEKDRKDLNMVLGLLSFMPGIALKALIGKIAKSHDQSGMLSPVFRQLDFGLKGLILGTYYSGKTGTNFKGKNPLEVIGFKLKRMVD